MSEAQTLSPLFTWRGAVQSSTSRLPASARHVALGLSLHMNERGGSAYPSLETLASECGLDRRTVQRSLQALESEGWLICVKRGGGRGKPSHWQASVPKRRQDAAVSQTVAAMQEKVTPVQERVTPVLVKGGRVPPEDVIEDVQEDVREDVAPKISARIPDPLFEVLAWVQTGHPYEPANPLTDNERGKINRATAQARKAGLSAQDLAAAVEGWGLAMPQGTGITALGLVGNATRCINAFHGASFTVQETQDRRRLAEAVAEGAESGRRARAGP